MEFNILLLTFSMLLGAVIGSFLNVVILRLPKDDTSIVFPASHCPQCRHNLRWYENIPIISYLVLQGKCSHCHKKISLQYPLVEMLNGLLFGAVYSQFGVCFTTLGYMLFCSGLVTIIWIDIYHQIIPDRISLPGTLVGFLFSFINTQVFWLDSLIGILAGGGVLWLVAVLYSLLRNQEGMGGGDIKLLAMIGAFLGYQSLLFVIFASSVTGSIIGVIILSQKKEGKNTRIPFGPFLSFSALTFLFFKEDIFWFFELYLQYMSS